MTVCTCLYVRPPHPQSLGVVSCRASKDNLGCNYTQMFSHEMEQFDSILQHLHRYMHTEETQLGYREISHSEFLHVASEWIHMAQ